MSNYSKLTIGKINDHWRSHLSLYKSLITTTTKKSLSFVVTVV